MTTRKMRRSNARKLLKAERRKRQAATLAASVALATAAPLGATVLLAAPAHAEGTPTGATITVDSNADTVDAGDGKTTLREAINQANGAGTATIDFNLGTGSHTVALTTPLPKLTGTTTITAEGITIDPSALGVSDPSAGTPGAITVDTAAEVTISGLDLTGTLASGTYAYGIRNQGSLTLTDSVVAVSEQGGFAVDIYAAAGSVQVSDSTLTDSYFGILALDGSVTVSGSTVKNNAAGGILAPGAPVAIDVTGSTLEGNNAVAIDATGGTVDIDGTSFTGNGGGAYVTDGSIEVHHSTFTGNYGTGIRASSGSATIYDSTFTDNYGAGLYADDGSIDVHDSTVTGSVWDGVRAKDGGSVTISGSTLSGNDGRGIYARGGSVEVADSTVRDNDGRGIDAGGGAVTVSGSTLNGNAGDGIYASDGSVDVSASTLYDNDGDGIVADVGGTVSKVRIVDSTITVGQGDDGVHVFASAGSNLGEVAISGSTIAGGDDGVYLLDSAGSSIASASIDDSTISGASTKGVQLRQLDGPTTISDSTIVTSGALFGVSVDGSSLTVVNSIITGADPTKNDGSDLYAMGSGYGSTITVDHSLIGFVSTDSGADTFTSSHSIYGTAAAPADPELGKLADNGGPTQTMLPKPGSPVIDAGASDATTDQRGLPRPVGTAADMGAVEVQPGASVTLAAPSGTTYVGQSATFTATVDFGGAKAVAGRVDLYDGSDKVGSTKVGPGTDYTDGTVQVPVVADGLSVGSGQSFTARFVSSAGLETSSEPSAAVSMDVVANPTATTLSTSSTAPTYRAEVTFTATVTPAVAGTVQFMDGDTALGSPVTVEGGAATYTTSDLGLGTHSVTAVFTPADSDHVGSTSTATTVDVAAISTTTGLVASDASPDYGDEVTFTATVPEGVAGTVQFQDGDTDLGEPVEVTDGTAILRTSDLAVGNHSITALFVPDSANYTGSTSAPAVQVTVAAAATTTHLRSSTDASTYGAEVTFTATAPDGVAGSVQFEDGDTDLGEPVEVSGGTATYATSELDAGEHHITAVFTPADRSYAASTSAVTTVTVAAASTTAELAVSASAPTAGDTVSFTAAVTDGVAGHVRFRDGDTPLGEAVAVEDGTATYSTNELPVGDHSITAVFTPSSSNYAGSTSDVVQVSVAPAPTGSGDDAPPPGDTAMPAPTPGPAPAPGPVPGVAPAPKKPKLLGAVVAGHKVHAVLPVVAGAPAGARTKIVWYVDGKKVGKGHKLKLKARWRGLKLTCTVTTTWGKGHHKHTVIKKSKAKRIKG